ncbi:MAG: hypothetical protein J0M18_09140 [Ignavibacteria bacterium]|jgi:hypothetical protein|nr:hypothetical protein [Ignavibacteria bacterium]
MKKLFVIYVTITVLSVLSFSKAYSCPKCNADFRQELLEKRANTLGGQELLEAIKNQDGGNSVVLPKNYVKQDEPLSEGMKQILAENVSEDNSLSTLSTFEIIKLFFTTWVFRS